MAMRCPSCQAVLSGGATFCLECGAAVNLSLDSDKPVCNPSAGTVVETAPSAVPPSEDDSALPSGTAAASPRLTEPSVSSDPGSTRACLLELQPGGRFHPWELRRPFYSVGRERTKITLTDPHVSRRHLVVVRVGTDWLAINLSDKRLRVNGWEVRQKTLRSGDVLRIGHTWLVFRAGRMPRPFAPLRPMAGAPSNQGVTVAVPDAVDTAEFARLTLMAGGRLAGSTGGQPLLVGNHSLCGVSLSGAGVAPFNCLIVWLPDGPHFFDLGGGILLGGAPMNQGRLDDGQTLTFGGQALTVYLVGDPCGPAAERLRLARARTPAVALTVIYGPHLGETALLPPGRAVLLGHAAGADLHLPEAPDHVPSRLELYLEPSKDEARARPVVRLREVEPSGGVLINRRPLAERDVMGLGDVLQFGQPKAVGPTALLLHHDLRFDAW
jgi:hypothetical protein